MIVENGRGSSAVHPLQRECSAFGRLDAPSVSCSICFEPMHTTTTDDEHPPDKMNGFKFTCNHKSMFHADCLESWVLSSPQQCCPICRAPINVPPGTLPAMYYTCNNDSVSESNQDDVNVQNYQRQRKWIFIFRTLNALVIVGWLFVVLYTSFAGIKWSYFDITLTVCTHACLLFTQRWALMFLEDVEMRNSRYSIGTIMLTTTYCATALVVSIMLGIMQIMNPVISIFESAMALMHVVLILLVANDM